MLIDLSTQQETERLSFRKFVEEEISPRADQFDREQSIPPNLIEKLARRGYLGAALPRGVGGGGLDWITYGVLNEEIGRGCSSVRSLLTVHDMVGHAILRWGTKRQQEYWLPKLASGHIIAAFGMTEANAGSDARQVETTAELSGDSYVLRGEKKWISFGQVAGLFLIFAQYEAKPTAFLVEKESPGFSVRPIDGLLGARASMLAELRLDDCRIPQENLVGRVGFGFSHVAASALSHGRYSVAWGCVGIGQACLEACLRYTSERKQFGLLLKEHQLIQRMISDMITSLRAARLLCLHTGSLMQAGDPDAVMEAMIAKYFASRMASQAASDAVQIHGANGCSSAYPVARYFRDAKVMEIIEGSTEIQQITIARYGYEGY